MPTVNLRALTETDLPALSDLLDRAADFYELTQGHPPGPAEASTMYSVLPEGKSSYEDKLLLGAHDADGELIGIADAICAWPDRDTFALGLLLFVPEARGHGNGSSALEQLERIAADRGLSRLRLGVDANNPRARSFWESRGYRRLNIAGGDDPVVLIKELTADPWRRDRRKVREGGSPP